MDDFIGIVIVNFNTYEETCDCIDSIKKYASCNYKIYIVENGSKKEIRNSIISKFESDELVSIIILENNLGYSGGNNVGIRKAIDDGANYILIANSDIEFHNNVIDILKKQLSDETPVAGPRITNLDNKDSQLLIKTYSTVSAIFDRMPFCYIKKIFLGKWGNGNKIKETIKYFGMVSGACFLIKADAFQQLGFFDDNVFLYSEERILSIKLARAGLKVCYEPEAKILHKEGQSTKKEGTPFADYHRYVSDYYTVVKYCSDSDFLKKIVKFLRLFNFYFKAKRNSDYQDYYNKLKIKFNEIDNGNYKIQAME